MFSSALLRCLDPPLSGYRFHFSLFTYAVRDFRAQFDQVEPASPCDIWLAAREVLFVLLQQRASPSSAC